MGRTAAHQECTGAGTDGSSPGVHRTAAHQEYTGGGTDGSSPGVHRGWDGRQLTRLLHYNLQVQKFLCAGRLNLQVNSLLGLCGCGNGLVPSLCSGDLTGGVGVVGGTEGAQLGSVAPRVSIHPGHC